MKLVLIRHGQTQWNSERRIHGWLDSPLTQQAKIDLSVLALPQLNNPLIFSSDLGRAYASATIISNRMGCNVIVDKRLRERQLGILQGQVIDQDKHLKFAWEKYHQRYIHTMEELQGVESEETFSERICSFLDEIENRHIDQDIIIVSHGEWLRALHNIIHGLAAWQKGQGIQKNTQLVMIDLAIHRR